VDFLLVKTKQHGSMPLIVAVGIADMAAATRLQLTQLNHPLPPLHGSRDEEVNSILSRTAHTTYDSRGHFNP
jgi:hypothetical protein